MSSQWIQLVCILKLYARGSETQSHLSVPLPLASHFEWLNLGNGH